MTRERMAFIISRNNLSLSAFSKNYEDLNDDEKIAIIEMMDENKDLAIE